MPPGTVLCIETARQRMAVVTVSQLAVRQINLQYDLVPAQVRRMTWKAGRCHLPARPDWSRSPKCALGWAGRRAGLAGGIPNRLIDVVLLHTIA